MLVASLFTQTVSANDEEKVRVGISRLNTLIEQNAYNDAHWQSYLNSYIFSTDGTDETQVFASGTSFAKPETITTLQNQLRKFAEKGKILYVALNGRCLLVGELKAGENQTFEKLEPALADTVYRRMSTITEEIYAGSKAKALNNGKNAILAMTPIQFVLAGKEETQDNLYWFFCMVATPGSAYPKLVQVVNSIAATASDRDLLQKEDERALAYAEDFMNAMDAYTELVEHLKIFKTPSANAFKAKYDEVYRSNPQVAKQIDEIAAMIDEDENSYKDHEAMIAHAVEIYNNGKPIDQQVKALYFNKEFQISRSDEGITAEFEAYKASLLAYREYEKNIIAIADAIECSPASGEEFSAFQVRVYTCASRLQDNAMAGLKLQTRKNLLCALSQMTLHGTSSVFHEELTSALNKESVVVRLLATTPAGDKKALLDYLGTTRVPDSDVYTLMSALELRLGGDDNEMFVLILADWVFRGYPKKATDWVGVLTPGGTDKRDVLPIFASASDDAYVGSYSGKTGVTLLNMWVNENMIGAGHGTKQGVEHDANNVPYYGYVMVYLKEDYRIGGHLYEGNEYHLLPAVLAELMLSNSLQKTFNTGVKYTFIAASTAVGISQIMAATSVLTTTVAAVDLAVNVADIAINEVMIKEIEAADGGKEFIDKWNRYVLIFQMTQVATELTGLIDNMDALLPRMKNQRATDLVDQMRTKLPRNTKAIDQLLDVGDDAVKFGDDADLALAQLFLRKAVKEEDFLDLLVHGSDGKFTVLLKGRNLEVTLDHRQLAQWLTSQGLNKRPIRLLSCSNAKSAEDLARQLGQDVYYSDGAVRVFSDGGITTANNKEWYKYSVKDRTALPTQKPRPPTGDAVHGDYVELGKDAKKVDGAADGMGAGVKIVKEITEKTRNHLYYGEIRIKFKDSKTPDFVSTPDRIWADLEAKFMNDDDFARALLETNNLGTQELTGMHSMTPFNKRTMTSDGNQLYVYDDKKSLGFLDGKEFFVLKNPRVWMPDLSSLIGTNKRLPLEKRVFNTKGRYIGKNGSVDKRISGAFPEDMTNLEIEQMISQAFDNKVNDLGNKYTSEISYKGKTVYFEIYIDKKTGDINSSYIISIL